MNAPRNAIREPGDAGTTSEEEDAENESNKQPDSDDSKQQAKHGDGCCCRCARKRGIQRLELHPTDLVNRHDLDRKRARGAILRERGNRIQTRVVLSSADEHSSASGGSAGAGQPGERQIHRFCAASGEDDLGRMRAQRRRQSLARVFE